MKPVAVELLRERPADGTLGWEQAMESPCASCSTSPCCTHLPLPGFPVENLLQLDHARWLLGFEGIELGISVTGEWAVFWTRACRHLDPETYGCTLHGMPEQPRICQSYNPYTCWYKRALGPAASPDHIRLDHRRLALLAPLVRFDERRDIVEVPSWEALQELYAEVPVAEPEPAPEQPDALRQEWHDIAVGVRPERRLPLVTADERMDSDRCAGCEAYCCDHLQFPVEIPTTAASLDYLRFALGFPGVELGVADDGWSLVIRTRCRHLEGNRCALFGLPERPLRCRYFDANQCPYPALLGEPRPAGFVRLRAEDLDLLEAMFQVDAYGVLSDPPPAEAVRLVVEAGWRDGEGRV